MDGVKVFVGTRVEVRDGVMLAVSEANMVKEEVCVTLGLGVGVKVMVIFGVAVFVAVLMGAGVGGRLK
jgi:hypothetical protein